MNLWPTATTPCPANAHDSKVFYDYVAIYCKSDISHQVSTLQREASSRLGAENL
jgi:hypothetical protein